MIEWFDDLKVGMKFKSEAVTVSKQDILRFAAEFDPQPFHLDEVHQVDGLRPAWRGRLHLQSDRDRAAAAGLRRRSGRGVPRMLRSTE